MKKFLIVLLLAILLLGALSFFVGRSWLFQSNTLNENQVEFFIPTNSSFQDVCELLQNQKILVNSSSFETVAKMMKYDRPIVPAGRYILAPSLSNIDLIRKLRAGNQSPINLTIKQGRTIEEVINAFAGKIEASESELVNTFTNLVILDSLGLNIATAISLIIPNTYEVYWDISPKALLSRFHKEHGRFWNSKRTSQLNELGLTKTECSTLASIVERESQLTSERPRIAGLYLNRIKQGVKLQADPTVVFGVGDFTIRRVLNKHTEHDSPYNTYIYKGLPPGPIFLPSINAIDAVLYYEKHDYIFMCAKPGYNGAHLFAKDNRQHERNANVYRRWLDSEGIRG